MFSFSFTLSITFHLLLLLLLLLLLSLAFFFLLSLLFSLLLSPSVVFRGRVVEKGGDVHGGSGRRLDDEKMTGSWRWRS